MKKLVQMAMIYLIVATVFEVLFASILEMAKIPVVLGVVARPLGLTIHTHLLFLGFFFSLFLILFDKVFEISKDYKFKQFLILYNSGLIISMVVLLYRSLSEIYLYEVSKILAMSVGTIGHIIISIALFVFVNILFRVTNNKK